MPLVAVKERVQGLLRCLVPGAGALSGKLVSRSGAVVAGIQVGARSGIAALLPVQPA